MSNPLKWLFPGKRLAGALEAFERRQAASHEKFQQQTRAALEKLRAQVRDAQESALKQRQMLVALGNALQSSDPSEARSSTTYKRCAEIIRLLSPMELRDARYVRVGKDYDGGYIMLDTFETDKIEAAYSFGISKDASWDEAIAVRGIDVFMYDHTIDTLPAQNPRFHFFKTGLAGFQTGESLKTLDQLMAANAHEGNSSLILKMDIEGCEWDVLEQVSSERIGQFSQIVIEFHKLTPFGSEASHRGTVQALEKINLTHQSVHVHANSVAVPVWIGGLVLPSLIEVTFVRRSDFAGRFEPGTRRFPTELDMPTHPQWPDILLGGFRAPPESDPR